MIRFVYHGEAVGKGRPRVTARKSKSKDNGQIYAHAYTPKKTKEFEDAIRFEFMASNCESMPVYPKETPLRMTVRVGVAIPKSYSKKKQALCRDGFIVPNKRPDLDNIFKACADALNGACFADDSQIAEMVAWKEYSEEPFVEVVIDEYKRP